MVWFQAHWKDVILAALAVDVALIPLFPKAVFLVSIKDFLAGFSK